MKPELRKAIYGVGAAVLTLLVMYGLVTAEQSTAYLDLLDKALAAGALLLAYKNVPSSDEE